MLNISITIASKYIVPVYNMASIYAANVTITPIDANTAQIEFQIYLEDVEGFFDDVRTNDFFQHYYESYDMAISDSNFTRFFRIADYNAHVDDVTTLIQLDD